VNFSGTTKYYSDLQMKNYNQDFYALFCVWQRSLYLVEDIRSTLQTNFTIIADLKFEWSSEFLAENSKRFYNQSIFHNRNYDEALLSKIGKGIFHVFVVIDHSPKIAWHRSVSGYVEKCNVNIIKYKSLFREWSSQKYGIHSSATEEEFEYQALLLFGPNRFDTLRAGTYLPDTFCRQDLLGAGEWISSYELISCLSRLKKCDYLLLRGEFSEQNGDVDILVRDFQLFASILNLKQERCPRPYKGYTLIAGKPKPVDLRFPSDLYFPPSWSESMLQRRCRCENLYVLSNDDYYFSNLYHQIIHKKQSIFKSIEDNRIHVLLTQGEQRSATPIDVLTGYLLSHKLLVTRPIDEGVSYNSHLAARINKKLLRAYNLDGRLINFLRQIKVFLLRLIPKLIKVKIKKFLKK
jgi:hypothetical protein